MDPLILLLGFPLFLNEYPSFFYWVPLVFNGPPHSSIGFSFVFPSTLLCFLMGSLPSSTGFSYVFFWVPFPLLLGSPSLSIGVLFVSDGNLPIRNQMGTTWKAQEYPIEE